MKKIIATSFLLIFLIVINTSNNTSYAQLNVPHGWKDDGETKPIYPVANDYSVDKQICIGTNTANPNVSLTIVGSQTVTGNVAIGTSTTKSDAVLNIVGSVTVSQGIKFGDNTTLASASGIGGSITAGSVTSALGYTPIANVQGSITTVLGYTPVANTQGSITTVLGYTPIGTVTAGSVTSALGYTPVANVQGSITSALGYTPVANTQGSVTTLLANGTVTGNLNATGTMTANSFVGNGSGLTNLPTSSVIWSGITGTPTDNSNISATPAASKIVYSTDGTLSNWIPSTQLIATTTTATANSNAQIYLYSSIVLSSGTNTISGGTASASCENGIQVAAYAFDGSTTTYWECLNDFPNWVQYQFPTPQTVDTIRIWSVSSSSELGSFTVHGSNDGASFTNLGNFAHGSNGPIPENYAITTSTYTYWRITCTSNANRGDPYTAIAEVQFAYNNNYYKQYQIIALDPVLGNIRTVYMSPGTETSKKSIFAFNGSTTIFGSTTSAYSGSSSAYVVDASAGNMISLSYVIPSTIDTKIIIDKGTRSNYLDDFKNLRVEKWYRKTGIIADKTDVENKIKSNFMQKDYELWKLQNIEKYTTITYSGTGSKTVSIDSQNLNNDFNAAKEIEWKSLINRQELINDAKREIEADTSKENIGLIVDDPSTPSYLKGKDKRTRDIATEIGALELAFQELIAISDKQKIEIDNLKEKFEK